MTTTYTIISTQDTFTHYSRCGYEGTYEGEVKQKWFTDRDAALDYLADLKIKDQYVIPSQENPNTFDHSIYFNGRSANNYSASTDLNDAEWDELIKLEDDFDFDLRNLFSEKESLFLEERQAQIDEEERQKTLRLAQEAKAKAQKQREHDLETLAMLQAKYGNV